MIPIETAPTPMRQAIVRAAFEEFLLRGYQGGSINRIISAAGATKGALFHHFSGKKALGMAVLDEVIIPEVQEHWVQPMDETNDPAAGLIACLEKGKEHIEEHVKFGCPLGNMSQEMSPLDEDFRLKIEDGYDQWRSSLVRALERGQEAGTVRRDLNPIEVAAFVLSSLTGMLANAKNAQSTELLLASAHGLMGYMKSLRP